MICDAAFRGGQPFVNLLPTVANIVGTKERERFRRCAIAARAPDFLVVTLDRLRQIGVRDPADVRLINAHAKGHGCTNDEAVLLLKAALYNPPVFGVHAAVVVASGVARIVQRLAKRFGFRPRAAIDDTRLPLTGGGEVKDLRAWAVFDFKREVDIRAVKAAQKGRRFNPVEELLHDFGAGLGVGGGGEGGERHVEHTAEFAYTQVVRTEIMTPLAHAMRLVDCDHCYTNTAQHLHRATRGQPFGRHIEKAQRARLKPAPDGLGLFLGIARGQRTCLDTCRLQGADLIAHQGDERRDDNRHPLTRQRRQLETKGFTATCGHNRKGVFTRNHGLHDLLLTGPEGIKTKDIFQQHGGAHEGVTCFFIWCSDPDNPT